jgi:adenosylmethionine-8-amino-7-oxononanoate aminotransferase
MGNALERRLKNAFAEHPHVGDIRGRGLFWGLELVEDRSTKQPFDPKLRMHARVKRAALEAGLMCYPMGGTIDGARGDHVLIAPPFIVEDAQLDELVDKLRASIQATLTEEVRT